jgi:hypothetical protein
VSRIRIAAIVEGHGDAAAVPVLLRRLWLEIAGGQYVEILKPIRSKRNLLEKEAELRRAVALAIAKLKYNPPNSDPALVLILFDRDPSPDLPCVLAPRVLGWATTAFAHTDIICVVANVEYESWFVAAAESLSKYVRLKVGEIAPANPEHQRSGKKWVETRFTGTRYSETQDQPAMTATMDLELCRSRSPSFDKLCRELERRAIAARP